MDIFQQDKTVYFEDLTMLKNSEVTRNIPVIVMVDDKSIAPKFLDLGVADYIVKPSTPAELNARILAQLQNKK